MKRTGRLSAICTQSFTILLTALFFVNASLLHAQTIRYVKPVPAGTGDGSSWANASDDPQLMTNNSAFNDLVFVAAGLYKASPGASYHMKEGVKIYGGFVGNETQLSQRNWLTNVTIIEGTGNVTIRNFNIGLTTASVLDGFTIRGGSSATGGGMQNYLSSPTITNCIFTGNESGFGSGMYNSNSAPVITNCTFINNATIDGTGGGIFNNVSSPVITNCSFIGNKAETGGGIYNLNSSPAITNCTFSDNECVNGCGIYNETSSPVIINSSFSTNNAKPKNFSGGGGGAIFNYSSSPSLSGCSFTGNNAFYNGGAAYNMWSFASFTNCSFLGNTSNSGGAILNNSAHVGIVNCNFSGNAASYGGGAINNTGSNPFINSCTFSANTADYGGVMYNAGGSPQINNSIFKGNKATTAGGAIYNNGGSPAISNCTFSGNNATRDAGFMYNYSGSAAVVYNSVIWGNSSAIFNLGATATIEYSIVQDGYPGTGNMNADPLFINAPSHTTAPFTGGNYMLYPCSPAINAGSNPLVAVGLTTDISGNPRINNMVVDMGAHEYKFLVQPGSNNILYVNSSIGSGTGTGSSWGNAMSSLADALLYAKVNAASWTAANPLKIFVAKGVYKPLYRPDLSCTSINANDRDNTFLMVNNVQLYGGFDPANGIDDLTDNRDFGSNGSILNGDIGTVNNNSDNSYHVVISSGLIGAARLDGFLITGANANGSNTILANGNSIDRNNGGAFYAHSSSPVIANCTLSGNIASRSGGAIYGTAGSEFNASNCIFTANTTTTAGGAVFNFANSPTFTDCSFSYNQSLIGGAIYNNGNASPSYTNCAFTANSAQYGGAIFNDRTVSAITNCSFSSNTASTHGGGIYNSETAKPVIKKCTFLSNTSGSTGGGIFAEPLSVTTVTECLFSGNNSQFGGAAYISGQAVIANSIFSGNWAASYGGAVYNSSPVFPSYINCIFSSNWTVNFGGGGGAMFNNQALPTITNATFSGNIADFGGAIHNYNAGFSTVVNSVIWGNNSAIYNESNAAAFVESTLIQGGYTGNGNLNTNPLFINSAAPAGPDNTWGTADDGLRPQVCSPVINTGNNIWTNATYTTDLVGHARVQLTTVDRGAYEANSFATGTAANIAASNTTTSAWQIRNAQTFYSTNCTTLVAAVTGDGTSTTIQGNTIVKTWIEGTPPAQFVKRHYEITPQDVTPATATGIITLYFTQGEFNEFNAANTIKLPQNPADATGKANLLIEKRGGISNNNTGLPQSYTGTITTINPTDANIVWNATALRWEVSFAVTGFSGFFVKTISIPLPLKLISFTASENNCIATIQWITTDEVNVSHFEVEQSTDGGLFNTIKNIPARNTGNENRYTIDVPVINNKVFYRLKMVDIDGHTTYSSVRFITAACDNNIIVYPNPAKDNLYIRNANPGSNYEIYDNMGKRISSGRIVNAIQEINIANMASGIYFINITDGGGNSRKLRFVTQ